MMSGMGRKRGDSHEMINAREFDVGANKQRGFSLPPL